MLLYFRMQKYKGLIETTCELLRGTKVLPPALTATGP